MGDATLARLRINLPKWGFFTLYYQKLNTQHPAFDVFCGRQRVWAICSPSTNLFPNTACAWTMTLRCRGKLPWVPNRQRKSLSAQGTSTALPAAHCNWVASICWQPGALHCPHKSILIAPHNGSPKSHEGTVQHRKKSITSILGRGWTSDFSIRR